jgi:hypothetical protein
LAVAGAFAASLGCGRLSETSGCGRMDRNRRYRDDDR